MKLMWRAYFGAHVVDDAEIRIILGVPLTVVEDSGELRRRAQCREDRIGAGREAEGSDLLGVDSTRPGRLRQMRVDDGGEPTRTAIHDDALVVADVVADVVPRMQRRRGDEARLGQSDGGVPVPQVEAARAAGQDHHSEMSSGRLGVHGAGKFVGIQSDNAIRSLGRVPKRIPHLPAHWVSRRQSGMAHTEIPLQSVCTRAHGHYLCPGTQAARSPGETCWTLNWN